MPYEPLKFLIIHIIVNIQNLAFAEKLEGSSISEVESMKRRVLELKKEKNAVILSHNYQMPEIQNVGDFVGDSLGLSKKAAATDAEIILFAGVDFMAESAKILSPNKTVVIPSREARCPMAAMITVPELRKLKKKYPDAATVAYVNTTAEIKAEVDICCTSSNAIEVVKSLPNKEVIFIPDTNLGKYVQRFVPQKKLIYCEGFCHVHHKRISLEDFLALREKHPDAEILVHPECPPKIIDIAHGVYSTQGMADHVSSSKADKFIIGTEKEMTYRLKKDNPSKTFIQLENAICYSMKKITLDKVIRSLETLEPEVKLPMDIIRKARIPLERMVAIGTGNPSK